MKIQILKEFDIPMKKTIIWKGGVDDELLSNAFYIGNNLMTLSII